MTEVARRAPAAGAAPLPPRPRGGLSAGLALALLALGWGTVLSSAAAPTALVDAGPVVRWAVPVSGLLVQVAAVVTSGAFLLCAVILPRGARAASPAPGDPTGPVTDVPSEGAWRLAARVGAAGALAWAVLHVVHLLVTHAALTGSGIGGPGYVSGLGEFLTRTGLGTALAWGAVLTAVLAEVASRVRTHAAAACCLVLGLVALVPVAATGHSATAANHGPAMSAMWLHLGAVTWWVGGLAMVVLLAPRLGAALPEVAARYSAVAGWCFAVVALSGVANAWSRLPGPGALLTGAWGWLLLAKVLLFGLLGVAGFWHRHTTLPALRTRSAPFWRLAAVEVAVMGAVVGLSVALADAEPPLPAPSAGGAAPPPAPGPGTYLTQWQVEPLFALAALAGMLTYLTWVRRLRRRGDAWPAHRTVSWTVGMVLFAWMTNGAPAVYGHLQFSAHMVQHMSLVMILPIVWVLAAPATLALRALPRRGDGSRGPREWLLTLLHSRWGQFFAHPVVAAANVVVSMALFYFTGLFELALRNHLAHVLMIVHFSLVGYLFINVLVGVDPGPARPPYPVRLVLLLPSMLFHTFFGLLVLSSQSLLAGDFFRELSLPWLADPLLDQQVGGGFTWAVGELPAIGLAVVLALRWAAADDRAEQRAARRAERGGHEPGQGLPASRQTSTRPVQ